MIEAAPTPLIDTTLVTLAALTLGMVLEMFRPLRTSVVDLRRWLNNGGLALLTYLSNHLLGTLIAGALVYRVGPISSLGLSAQPLWLQLAVTFILFELARYAIHVAMHKVPLLWRIHAVHHADNEMDISTAFRHHPIEGALSALPLAGLVLLLSAAPAALLAYRACDLVMAVLTHTNVAVPRRLEGLLRFLLVTPAFHRTHHMAEQRFTDSNYGLSVPWFDYLFGTYQQTTEAQQQQAAIGLDTHTANEQRLDGMLIAPFVTRRATESTSDS
ncbi:sterol desaturase family protein [Seongchinamella sediminis]|uniref:Sterol desaturase family protein n=1 Tax=Seongchinamella sediminis TaxID=2283635 RepID=A0A3L7DX26_9GAMM|nr:sterol desaturase family protein [Seongchinamella sediminis]RLQ21874.1 sterol desaturase family protein [Seongchinamella sediminis]